MENAHSSYVCKPLQPAKKVKHLKRIIVSKYLKNPIKILRSKKFFFRLSNYSNFQVN